MWCGGEGACAEEGALGLGVVDASGETAGWVLKEVAAFVRKEDAKDMPPAGWPRWRMPRVSSGLEVRWGGGRERIRDDVCGFPNKFAKCCLNKSCTLGNVAQFEKYQNHSIVWEI